MEQLSSNEELDLAREFLASTSAHLFLTGRAGTGKTTFLNSTLSTLNKRAVVAAPTGVAALNARGVTLHSLFQLPFSPFIPGGVQPTTSTQKPKFHHKIGRNKIALIRSIELLVIDEISMVRCDVLDAVDATLRRIRRNEKPFGGVQLLMIGDVQQLSPICRDEEWTLLSQYYRTPYFFESKALAKCSYITIELQQIFRQKDENFTSLLNAVREGNLSPRVIEQLNERYIPNFLPDPTQGYITLTTHNHTANAINSRQMEALTTATESYNATLSGDFPESSYPNSTDLELKVGAQVIFIKNDTSPQKLYYNGMIGEIVRLDRKSAVVQPKDGGEPIEVGETVWENVEYKIDEQSGEIAENVKGTFTQMPLKCAWAITIHKSQGLSFDRAVIDASSSFAHGQVYVALSRCRTLEGMVLRSPISHGSLVKDSSVEAFNHSVVENHPTRDTLEEHQRHYYASILREMFDYTQLRIKLATLSKLCNINLYKEYPKTSQEMAAMVTSFSTQIEKVGHSFGQQLTQAVLRSNDYRTDSYIAERLTKAADYFEQMFKPLFTLVESLEIINSDVKEVKKRLGDLRAEITEQVAIVKISLALARNGFSVEEYLKQKFKVITDGVAKPTKSKASKSSKASAADEAKAKSAAINDMEGSTESENGGDIENVELYQTLAAWRLAEAQEIDKPAFVVAPNKLLIQIAMHLPTTLTALRQIKGMGDKKIAAYGSQIIEIVTTYCFENDL